MGGPKCKKKYLHKKLPSKVAHLMINEEKLLKYLELLVLGV